MAVRDFLLPDLGEGLEDAEVITWKVSEGDRVELNQTLVEVNTAKALVDIPAPWEGVIQRLHAAEGDVVKVGQPLVSIETEGAGEEPKPKRKAVLVGYGVDEEDEMARARRSRRGAAAAPATAGAARATPPVRKLAKDLGVDLSGLTGTGPDGRITREDVEAASRGEASQAASPEAGSKGEPTAGTSIPVTGTRRLIAEKMSRSAREIPHVTTFLTVDFTWVEEFRGEISKQSGERVTALPIVVRALAEISSQHPKLNSSFNADVPEIVVHEECNVGIATDTEDGLLVPVVHAVKTKGIVEIAKEIATLSTAARERKLKPEQMQRGTITITNVGSFGSEYGTPIINHPEAAIVAVGAIAPRPLVVDGEVEARPAATLSLTFDHRVMDGAEAGRALKDLGRFLESAFRLGALPR
jgi:2-oxoisovalerate dehydrogenase E2 component (dihydrolipoyl transacylase)